MTSGKSSEERPDVLVVEDDESHLKLLTTRLSKLGLRTVSATDGQGGWQILLDRRPRVVLSDWVMPGLDGVSLCRRIKGDPELAETYFIVVTSRDDVEAKIEALNNGADDYLVKPYDFRELLARVRVGLRVSNLQNQLKRAATVDTLTGLYNQQHFLSALRREYVRAIESGSPLSLMFIDLDKFKDINDRHGHQVGNEVLEKAAQAVRKVLREIDIAGRFGGDEFTVLLPATSEQHAREIALGILENIGRVEYGDGKRLGASIGVACSDDVRVASPDDLIRLADEAVYLAKARGRNCVATAEEIRDEAGVGRLIEIARVKALRSELAALGRRAKDLYVYSIFALIQALEARDPYTAYHSRNVTWYAVQIATEMGLADRQVESVRCAAMLHDIGKIGVPDRILSKTTPLTEEEWAVIRRVPLISAQIADQLRVLRDELPIIRHQHERYDGKGYPAGLKGAEIPLGARILFVADAFDAMTTDRVYRRRKPVKDALEEIATEAGKQFDPEAVRALLSCWRKNREAWERKVARAVRWLESYLAAQQHIRQAVGA